MGECSDSHHLFLETIRRERPEVLQDLLVRVFSSSWYDDVFIFNGEALASWAERWKFNEQWMVEAARETVLWWINRGRAVRGREWAPVFRGTNAAVGKQPHDPGIVSKI
jgi:hypothetical protein